VTTTTASPQSRDSLQEVHDGVRADFQTYASEIARRRRWRSGYLSELIRRYRFYVEPGSTVLEVGVGTGDLLSALGASRGVGVDVSPEMIEIARASHPELELHHAPAEDLGMLEGPFDYIVLSDLTVHVYDILVFLQGLGRLCHQRTRLVLNFHSRLWQPVLHLLASLGLAHKHYRTNWVTAQDMRNLLRIAGYEIVKVDRSTLVPANVPLLSTLANRFLFRIPLLNHLCLVNWIVARPRMALASPSTLTVSVICPCRNEAGNVKNIVQRVPAMGRQTELIFIEGGSTDATLEAIQEEVLHQRGNVHLKVFKQTGVGKSDAVRLGFSKAGGDVLMILDADLTVQPEDLPAFLAVLASGEGEFVNGSRLVYPMNDQAMRFLNLLGNKFFALCFSYILSQPIRDTLCGTKVLVRRDYERIAQGRSYFGEFDPFGDFDLLFGASKLNLKIIELPVRYRERVYGSTNIRRFRDGWVLLRMGWFGLRRFKFI
jgi:ubiquinone/menaquinone biosynthesis C-methylase UbiE